MSQTKEFTEEELKEIESLAYSAMKLSEIAAVVEVDATQFAKMALTEGNPVYSAYLRGKLKAIAAVRKSVIDAAAAGSTPAQNIAFSLFEQHQADIEKNYAPS